MIKNTLSKIQIPSRYLGNETNTIHKDWNKIKLHIALAFPDLYEIGTSHFGIQILYSILNNRINTLAERVFAPADDMEEKIRSGECELQSLESKKSLISFDIIGFSLLYELNYTNVLNMLSLSNIPFEAAQRDDNYPLLIAGGPCTFNPEPIAIFFDAIVIGDGEEVIIKMANAWDTWKKDGGQNKDKLFEKWSKIQGVYIPSFFKTTYDSHDYQKLEPIHDTCMQIKKAIVTDLAKTPLPLKPIVPFGKPVHDRLRIEVSRGCTRGCRFCQAGMIYRPVRERSPKEVLNLVTKSIDATGYEDISLLSLSTGDYSCILPLMEEIIDYGTQNNLAISLPSLRADTLTPKIMQLVKKIRKTGFTIAPEAGSQRLRDVINKNITKEDIINTIKSAFSLGWKVIKLYFMIGLPTECQDDLQEIVDLVKELNLVRKTFSVNGKINVSVTTFVPKAHTPFQWVKQNSLEDSKAKIYWLKEQLKIPGIHFKWQDPNVSLIEGLLARGDRRSALLLVSAHKKGCKFDGWSDHFNFSRWKEVLNQFVKNDEKKSNTFTKPETPFPWDHIDIGIDKDFFLQELKKSISQEKTKDCRYNKCQNCGVCDFKLVNPVLHPQIKLKKNINITQKQKNTEYKKIKVLFSKTDSAKYFGHLEMAKIFYRSLRRAKVPVKYSEGFHPSPKVSFNDPLPIGMESLSESMTITVSRTFQDNSFRENMNKQLPSGLYILECSSDINNVKSLKKNSQSYLIELREPLFNQSNLDSFLNRKNNILSSMNKKGKNLKYDLKRIIKTIEIHDKKILKLVINIENGPILRPKPILNFIFELNREALESAKIIKL